MQASGSSVVLNQSVGVLAGEIEDTPVISLRQFKQETAIEHRVRINMNRLDCRITLLEPNDRQLPIGYILTRYIE